jgi:hypothetical protein
MPLFERGRLEIEVSHIHPKLSWYSPGLFIFLHIFLYSVPSVLRSLHSKGKRCLLFQGGWNPISRRPWRRELEMRMREVGDTLFCPFRQAHRLVLE